MIVINFFFFFFPPDMGLTLGMAVVVKELTEGGNAHKSGVKLGDQLLQVLSLLLEFSLLHAPIYNIIWI